MTLTPAQIDQEVGAKSTQFANDAHKENVQKAAENLFKDGDFKSALQTPGSDFERQYSLKMTEDLVKQNLLPSLSLSYLDKNFDKIDTRNETGKLSTLTLAEVRAAQNGFRDGSIYANFYKTVGDMMESGQLPKEITKEQLTKRIEESNKNFQSQDKKNAAEAADALINDKSLFSNIAQNDHVITLEDLDKFLDKPGNASPETIRKLRWMQENWDDGDVRALTMNGKDGVRGLSTDSLGEGVGTLKSDIVVEPGKPVEYGSRIPPLRAWGRDDRPPSADPKDKPHDWYVSDGKGNTVAVDFDGNGKPIYTVGTVDASGSAHYTAWHYEKETGKYVLLDKDQIIAEATGIDFRPSDGQLTPEGLLPRASEEEKARQAGAY